MSSSKEHYSVNDEINLIELLVQLWVQKFTVLVATVLCGCIGLAYIFLGPEKYAGEFVLRGPTGPQLVAYTPLNDSIMEHFLTNTNADRDSEDINPFELSSNSLVVDMVRELQDYDEFERALKEFSATVRDMTEDEFNEERSDLRSKFAITPATDTNPDVKISFTWSDEAQLLNILSKTLQNAERNLNAAKHVTLDGLANNIERRNGAKLEELNRALLSVMEITDLETESRLLFLEEQAAIAREINLSGNGLFSCGNSSQVSSSISSTKKSECEKQAGERREPRPEAIYLRGYQSLEKEAALIRARSDAQSYLLNPNFVAIKREASVFKNDGSAENFRKIIEASPFASDAAIFNISERAIEVSNIRKPALVMVLSLLLGFLAGCGFVLIGSALKQFGARETI